MYSKDILLQILFRNASSYRYLPYISLDTYSEKMHFWKRFIYIKWTFCTCYLKEPSGESFCEANTRPLFEFGNPAFSHQACLRGKQPRVTIWWLKFPFSSASRFCSVDKPQLTTGSSGWAFCVKGTLQVTCWLHTECLIYLLCDWLIWGNFYY